MATTIYRKNFYTHRQESLEKMNNTLARHNLQNPMKEVLQVKMFFAAVFNIQKKQCPMPFLKKQVRLKN